MPDDPIAPPAPVTLFLSYARSDQARATALARALEGRGYRVWWDGLIEGGSAFARSISDALEAADAVLVLWSKNSIESDWVRDEAAQGRDRHRLLPLSLDGTPPPLGFRQYQCIDLSHWHGRNGAGQIDSIHRAISAVVGQQAEPRRESRGISRRGLLQASAAAGVLAVAGGGLVAWQRGLFGGGEPSVESIAVLPFRNLSGDESQAYFSDGLTDEIRAALARVDALQVLASTSSQAAVDEDKDEDAVSIARKLKVGYLLDGSVRRAGDMVRIAAELTDGRTGFSRWSTVWTRKLSDIFAVQSDIARTVANALSIQIATDRPAPGGTHNIKAFENFLQGRALFNQAKDEASDRAALEHFDLAIAADPRFAMAYAARSRALAAIATEHAKADELKQTYADSIASARRAVEIAPDMAEGQLALGYALFAGRLDADGARPYYQRAYALGRGNADVVLLYALYCSRTGQPEEAIRAGERAVVLDPLNARAFRAQGSIDYAVRRYADALDPLKRALELNPKISFAHSLRGSALMQLGRLPEAKAEFEAEPGDIFKLTGLAIVEQRMGNRGAAEKAFDQLVTDVGDSALYQQAQVLSQWGRKQDAIARLRKAREVGDSGLIYLASDPLLDPLRKESGFSSLLNSLT